MSMVHNLYKRRIDKLTFKIREAERREKEAIKFAEAVNARKCRT